MTKDIKCELCGCVIGKEVSGKEKYYDRVGSYFYSNIILAKNAHSDKICENCYKNLQPK